MLLPFLLMQLIKRIRQSARLITSLPPDLQRIARDSYSASLKSVFFFAACSTLLAYLVRLPVSYPFISSHPSIAGLISCCLWSNHKICRFQTKLSNTVLVGLYKTANHHHLLLNPDPLPTSSRMASLLATIRVILIMDSDRTGNLHLGFEDFLLSKMAMPW